MQLTAFITHPHARRFSVQLDTITFCSFTQHSHHVWSPATLTRQLTGLRPHLQSGSLFGSVREQGISEFLSAAMWSDTHEIGRGGSSFTRATWKVWIVVVGESNTRLSTSLIFYAFNLFPIFGFLTANSPNCIILDFKILNEQNRTMCSSSYCGALGNNPPHLRRITVQFQYDGRHFITIYIIYTFWESRREVWGSITLPAELFILLFCFQKPWY